MASGGDGIKVLLSPEGEVDATTYLEPASGKKFAIDHASLTATPLDEDEEEDGAAAVDGEIAAARDALEAALKGYAASQYARNFRGGGGPALAVYAATNGTLTAVLKGERVNLRNFYSGSWASTWAAAPAASGFGYDVSGEIAVRAHYFENGNVQLQTTKAIESAAAKDVDAVAALIEAAEGALQRGLEAMYDDMTGATFKAMRRTLPVSRTKMKWNVHEIALNKNLRA